MFMQWRGSLEYRFDIIASQFHTGRLIVGYVPGLTAIFATSNGLYEIEVIELC